MISRPIALTRKTFLRTLVGSTGATVGALVLAACGTTTAAPPAPTEKPAPATPAGQATKAPPKAAVSTSAGAVTITYWDYASVWRPLLQKLVTDFDQQHPSIKVNLQIPPDYYTKLQVAFAGGTGPDAYKTSSPNAFALAYRNVFLDLSERILGDAQVKGDFQGMAAASRKAVTYRGKVIAMPFGGTLEMTIYNEDLVKKAGLTAPADLGKKWDWNAVQEYGGKLTQRQGSARPSIYGFWVNQAWEEGWLNFVLANGGEFLDPTKDYRACLIAAKPAVEAIQYLVDLVLKAKISPTTQDLSAQNGDSQFFTGKIAIMTAGSWQIPQIRQAKINFNITEVPIAPSTGKSASNSNFSMIGVNPKTKLTDAAVAYALWNGSAGAQKTIGSFEYMPASLAAAQATYFQPSLGPSNRKVLADILQITTPQPSPDIVSFDDLMNITQQEIPLIFLGKDAVADGLKRIQDRITAKLEQALKNG